MLASSQMNSRTNLPQPHGFVVIDKPAGITSHDVVARIRRIFRTKRVGHTGTLDPQATGIMVVCLGTATRLAEYLSASSKTYRAGITFGITTSTQDIWGDTLTETPADHLTAEQVELALPALRGDILQVPPMVSALHHEGRRLYDLAREGVEVERDARPIHVSCLDLVSFVPGPKPEAVIDVSCSAGAYIRTIAHDIGHSLGCGAAMSSLRRTEVGSVGGYHFGLGDAYTLDTLKDLAESEPLRLLDCLLPLTDAVVGWQSAKLTPEQVLLTRQGRFLDPTLINWDSGAPPPVGQRCALLSSDGETLVAIAEIRIKSESEADAEEENEAEDGKTAETGPYVRPLKVLVTEERASEKTGDGKVLVTEEWAGEKTGDGQE